MVVNDCKNAVKAEIANNLTPYTTTACADDSVIKLKLDDVRISYKLMA